MTHATEPHSILIVFGAWAHRGIINIAPDLVSYLLPFSASPSALTSEIICAFYYSKQLFGFFHLDLLALAQRSENNKKKMIAVAFLLRFQSSLGRGVGKNRIISRGREVYAS